MTITDKQAKIIGQEIGAALVQTIKLVAAGNRLQALKVLRDSPWLCQAFGSRIFDDIIAETERTSP